jgi:hypothetical protein
MIGIRYGQWCVRVTHRATGLSVALWRTLGTGSTATMQNLRADALRLLRARRWQRRHRFGPQPLVRTYDLTGKDRERVGALLDGDGAFGGTAPGE